MEYRKVPEVIERGSDFWNCNFCKHYKTETMHQPGFGTRYSYYCKLKHRELNGAILDCDDFEHGEHESSTWIL